MNEQIAIEGLETTNQISAGTSAPHCISVCSIIFGEQAFRKLKELTIPFAKRITLIAGHNGIGKSTILALVANNSGISSAKEFKSYFDAALQANLQEILHIDLKEVEAARAANAIAPRIVCLANEITIVKECSLTVRSEYKRARIVPRTIPHEEIDANGLRIGPDAKIPLPTLYLGIKRMLPAGEALESEVSSMQDADMAQPDRKLIADFMNEVILGGSADESITSQSIKGARKITKQPGYSHDPRAISLGQDSLSSIATALASFNRLKRDWPEYPGGLLIIDELDAGLHPHAIGRLADSLKKFARRLNLQIIATTHSPRLIEAIHPDGDGNARSPDSVLYLHDTNSPRLAPDQSLSAVLADMTLRRSVVATTAPKPLLHLYFEDEEAAQFFLELVPPTRRAAIGRKHTITLKPVPLGIGGSNLVNLPKHDPRFKDVLLVVDADTSLPSNPAQRANMLKLPGALDATGKGMSPERTIKSFLNILANATTENDLLILRSLKVSNPSTDLIRNQFFSSGAQGNDRDKTKSWWQDNWLILKEWGVIQAWASANKQQVTSLWEATDQAAGHVAARLRSGLAKQVGTR